MPGEDNPAIGVKRVWYRLPSVQALLIQGCAFMVATGLYFVVASSPWSFPLVVFALLQGISAASLAHRCGSAKWWLYIHLLFPIAVYATQQLHIAPSFFLAGFVALTAVYWSTFRTQVPFYPSSAAVAAAVIKLLPVQGNVNMIDIGSGLGGLLIRAAAARADIQFTGIELAPLPWLFSAMRNRHGNCRFLHGDYDRLDFSHYDVVFAYLSTAAMPYLWHKAAREMRAGTLLLSYEFEIPGVNPSFTSVLEPSAAVLYGWRM